MAERVENSKERYKMVIMDTKITHVIIEVKY